MILAKHCFVHQDFLFSFFTIEKVEKVFENSAGIWFVILSFYRQMKSLERIIWELLLEKNFEE